MEVRHNLGYSNGVWSVVLNEVLSRLEVSSISPFCINPNLHPFFFRDDLALGHKSTSWYKSMEDVCLGDAKTNIRAQEPESGLSVESQVACLIDHAIDPNILGRTYDGWEPWM